MTVEGNRPFERFIVDGVALDPSVRSHTLTVKDGWNGEPYGNVTAVFGTNWYVNAASSNDNNGGAPTDAKQSLQGALQYAKGGDVVHVAEGTYDHDDAPWSPQSSKVKSRALVPTDVRLVADGAVENTIIVGADAPSPDEGGCGDGATRCVFLNMRSVVKGFTLRGGRTAAGNDANTDHYAGGVYCANMTGRVIDCLITDCRSTRGAGGQNGRYVNCRFIGNKSYNLAPAVRYGELYGCYLADNIGNNTVQNLSNGVYNCTFGAGNLEKPTATWGAGVGVANTVVMDSTTQPGPVVNCVFLAGNYHNSTHPTNCVYDQAVGGRNKMSALAKNILVVPGLASQFADGKPVSQTVGTVDFGEVADLPEGFLTDTDLGGGQRIYNAKIDAGCYEFDWRPVYARKILKSGWLTVVSVSPEATAVENGVFLPSGSLVLNWGRAASDAFDHIAAFGVTGDGTLAVTQGEGDPALYAKGTYRETRALDVGDNRFVFAYTPSAEDAGGAVVGPFKRDCGLMLMIR